MSATDKALVTTTAPLNANEAPVPQYYNETADEYQVQQGADGALYIRTKEGHTVSVQVTGSNVTLPVAQQGALPAGANTIGKVLSDAEGTPGSAAPSKVAMLGATDGTNAQALKVDTNKALLVAATNVEGANGTTPPSKGVLMGGTDGTFMRFLTVAGSDNDGVSTARTLLQSEAYMGGYNGASWDRWRNNTEGTLLASAARTATTNSPDQTNHNAKGVIIYLNVTAASGTGGLQVRIQAKDPVSGGYYSINAAPTAITVVGGAAYELYPGVANSNMLGFNYALPRTWRVQVQHSDSSSYTYSVGYSLIV